MTAVFSRMRALTIALGGSEFGRGHGLVVADVEAEAVGSVQAPLLGDVGAELTAQRFVQQVGGAVMRADAGAAGVVHDTADGSANFRFARLDCAEMQEQAELLLGVGDADTQPVRAGDHALIANLAAALRIKRRLVQHHGDVAAGFDRRHRGPAGDERHDLGLGRLGRIAEEFAGADGIAQLEPDLFGGRLARSAPGGAGTRPLLQHGGIEPGDIDGAAVLPQRVLGEIEGKSVGIVKPERDIARQGHAIAELAGLVGEEGQAAFEHGAEARLLEFQGLADQGLGLAEFRVGSAHLAHQGRHQLVEDGIARAHHVQMAHRAAHDPAQHIAAPLVGGQHAVGDQEGRAAQMVGDHTMAGLGRTVGGLAGGFRAGGDQRAEHVRVVIVVHALQDGGDALQAHAGVDGGARQRRARAGRPFLELHEHQVPDFDEPVAILVRAARRPAGNMVAMVEEDFGTGAARAGVAHAPEIVRGGDADDAVVGEAGDLAPEGGRVLVLGIHRHQQLLGRKGEILGDQRPGKLDRFGLEIIPEGEIAEHFEEGVMPGRVADIVEVVMLAAGAHAFLRRDRARVGAPLLAGKDVLELHHAGVGEEQGGVVARHQRRTRDRLVFVAREIIEEGGPYIVAARHGAELAH